MGCKSSRDSYEKCHDYPPGYSEDEDEYVSCELLQKTTEMFDDVLKYHQELTLSYHKISNIHCLASSYGVNIPINTISYTEYIALCPEEKHEYSRVNKLVIARWISDNS